MRRSTDNPWLHRFAAGSALATLVLVCFGGLVTSHGAGLAVPDWPNSYGYNMFLFPVSKWVGGIFYEHTHRLAASGVGLLTVFLAIWLWRREARPWLRHLGGAALVLVVAQGILGGLRVTLLKDELGIVHAALAQIFFTLLCAVALFTSRWWNQESTPAAPATGVQAMTWLAGATTVVILCQLVLGAAMRHAHAGLAIGDFPLAYGRLWPAMDAESIARYNQLRVEASAQNPITAGGVALQMAHRATALLILAGVTLTAWLGRRQRVGCPLLGRLSLAWLGLIGLQICLGAATIWSNKSADIATAHVAVGALTLATGTLLVLAGQRRRQPAAQAPEALARGERATQPNTSPGPLLAIS